MLKRYISQPVEIEAVQFTPETRDYIIELTGCRHQGCDEDGCIYETAHLFISTLEGEMMASVGDYIVRGLEGEFYPCKPSIFEKKYLPLLREDKSAFEGERE